MGITGRLTNRQLLDKMGDLWEERWDHIRRGLILSALLGACTLVLWWMTQVTYGTTPGLWLVSWALLQAGLVIDAWLRVRNVDDRAEKLVEQSEFYRPILTELARGQKKRPD